MKAAIPTSSQSTSTGLAILKVEIMQIVPERGVAIVQDKMGYNLEIPYRVQRAKGRMPKVGEVWYLDRALGPWSFLAYVAPDDSAMLYNSFDVDVSLGTANRLLIGSDTNLYRGAANMLKTDDSLTVGSTLLVNGATTLTGLLVNGDIQVTGSIIKATATKHTPTFGTDWADGPTSGTIAGVTYHRDDHDNLVIVGAMHATSTTPAATAFSLSALFRPQETFRMGAITNKSGTITAVMVEVNSSGAVSVSPNPVLASTDVYLQLQVPMGNIA